MRAIIFDLDMTLLDTSGLAAYRELRNWTAAKKNYHLINFFTYNGTNKVHEIPLILNQNGYLVAVVTNSPRTYAEDILKTFNIYYDELITWEDTTEHKPSPDPLNLAIERLGVNQSECVYIGDSWEDNKAAFLAGILSIGAGWGIPRQNLPDYLSKAPDILLLDPSKLLPPVNFNKRGYIGEEFALGNDVAYHKGAKLRVCDYPKTFSLGRYYQQGDIRHGNSLWSQKIISFKQSDDDSDFFANCIARFLNKLTWKPNIITCVPPKPDQEYSRFDTLLEVLPGKLEFKVEVINELLHCNSSVEGYKKMGAMERVSALRDVYGVNQCVPGKVLVIDDVKSSGATARKISSTLLEKGIDEVRFLTFGVNQFPPFEEKECPECTRKMKVRQSKYGYFWGCTGYKKDDENSCSYIENIM